MQNEKRKKRSSTKRKKSRKSEECRVEGKRAETIMMA